MSHNFGLIIIRTPTLSPYALLAILCLDFVFFPFLEHSRKPEKILQNTQKSSQILESPIKFKRNCIEIG